MAKKEQRGHTAADFTAARKYAAVLLNELTGGRPANATAHFVVRFAETAFLAGVRYQRDKEKDNG